jgi:UDP-2,3-diacylglucosamine pyrophosphatase LpxH
MADIRYVVLSDMHLGAENSLLTDLTDGTVDTDTVKPAPLLIKLAECLREIISKNKGSQKPTLVLNGDLAELALTTSDKAGMAYQRFLELVMPDDGELLFDKEILFLPGNHDHNLWERARFYYNIEQIRNIKPGEKITPGIHVTKMFSPPVIESAFLTILLQCYPHLKDASVKVSYPAHAVLNEQNNKCIIFCHGHYIESMYSLMTSLRDDIFPDRINPETLGELETENFAWVDFFWSDLGRSGSVGKDIDLIYDKLQSPAEVNILLENIATSLTKKKKKGIIRWLEKKALLFILKLSVGHMASTERDQPDVELSPDATQGLKNLMENEIYNQLRTELGNTIPDDISFIFGHTHKPFQRKMKFNNYANEVKVFNSGGWVVDTMNQESLIGGSIILADDNFDVVALQMYKEGNYKISFEELDGTDKNVHSDFYNQLVKDNDLTKEPWSSFATTASDEVNLRYSDLKIIVKEDN